MKERKKRTKVGSYKKTIENILILMELEKLKEKEKELVRK